MTGRDRVVAAYKGEFADCVPAYPIAGSFAGCLDGLSIEEYCTSPKKAVKAMLNYYERYQPDIMIAFNDLAKEVEAVLAANAPKFMGAVPPDAEALLEELVVFGTPAEARRRLARWHEAGAALPILLLQPNLAPEELELTLDALRPLPASRA